MPKRLNLAGKIFGDLLVLEDRGNDVYGSSLWECRCACGIVKIIKATHLMNGKTKSCGCGVAKAAIRKSTIHGMSRTLLYRRWIAMKARVKTNPNYAHISICARWDSFENFAQDMELGFMPELTLERIDNMGNYCPENCRWASRKEQQRNRRNNNIISHAGFSMTVQEWGEILEIKPNTIITRLRRGWSIERALS